MKRIMFILVFFAILIACFVLLSNFTRISKKINYKKFDEPKLHGLSIAVRLYENKYGDLPTEENFKNSLLNNGFASSESMFYSDDTDILIRYFRHGNYFVLVSPGKNKKYETPEGYENLKGFNGKTDDIVIFDDSIFSD